MAIALIVETGSGVSGANTYISATDADLYQANRGRSSWTALSDDAKAVALIMATEAIDSLYPWIGSMTLKTQGLKWPRVKRCVRINGSYVPYSDAEFNPFYDVKAYTDFPLEDRNGFPITGIPQAVVNACAEAAFLGLSEEIFQNDDPRGKITRKKTDILETFYQEESPSLKPAMPTIFGALNAMLKGLYVAPSNGMQVGRVVRG